MIQTLRILAWILYLVVTCLLVLFSPFFCVLVLTDAVYTLKWIAEAWLNCKLHFSANPYYDYTLKLIFLATAWRNLSGSPIHLRRRI